jgi:hypothetical protein
VGSAAKWDGFRLLIEVGDARRVRAWSRHRTSLTARLSGLTAAFAEAPPGSAFDGELAVASERGGHAVQDFAAVCRAGHCAAGRGAAHVWRGAAGRYRRFRESAVEAGLHGLETGGMTSAAASPTRPVPLRRRA